MKHRLPSISLDVGSIVKVESIAWASIVSLDLQSFPDLQIMDQVPLVLVLHGFDDLGIVSVKGNGGSMVLGYSRVLPFPLFNCTPIFCPSGLAAATCLANVGGGVGTGALVEVDPFLFEGS